MKMTNKFLIFNSYCNKIASQQAMQPELIGVSALKAFVEAERRHFENKL